MDNLANGPDTQLNLAIFTAAGVVLLLGLFSGDIKNRLWLSEPMICLVVGILLGPVGLGLTTRTSTRPLRP
jgi:NhaP-type Na+/H+ or K+/H+ antiporter